jgi:hypothetical protein
MPHAVSSRHDDDDRQNNIMRYISTWLSSAGALIPRRDILPRLRHLVLVVKLDVLITWDRVFFATIRALISGIRWLMNAPGVDRAIVVSLGLLAAVLLMNYVAGRI